MDLKGNLPNSWFLRERRGKISAVWQLNSEGEKKRIYKKKKGNAGLSKTEENHKIRRLATPPSHQGK